MGMIAKAELLANQFIQQEDKIEFCVEAGLALCGDIGSIAKVIALVIKNALSFSERMFWDDLKDFIEGMEKHDEEYGPKLSAKLVAADDQLRLLKIIRDIQSKQQIHYLVNATRCLLAGLIDRNLYFRLCYLISHTLVEDLQFLQSHITDGDREYKHSVDVQGLVSVGLMYLTTMDFGDFLVTGQEEGDGNKYSFMDVAYDLDKYALSFDDVSRYPSLKESYKEVRP